MSFVETVANEWAEIAAQEQAGVDGLRELLLEPVPDAQLKQRIATVLARARHPLLASEILDLIVTHFEPAGSPTPTLVEVRSQLRSAPEFTQPARYRWQVGRSAPRLLSVRA